MKKKLLMIVCGLILVLGGLKLSEELFGVDILPEMPAITPRQKQLQYLKDHEQEIIDFVKAQNPKIESVQIDWDDVRWGKGGMMFHSTKFIKVFGKFNGLKNSGWGVRFPIEGGKVDVEGISLSNPLRVGGQYFE